MIDPDGLARQILNNCDISDALHAGLYSICGLALRLRDLYKWQNGLDPWVENEPAEVLAWISQKEDLWEGLLQNGYQDLCMGNRCFEPFDTAGINRVLAPLGLYYGAGYAQRLKPTFFLGVITETRAVSGIPVYVIGRELARDLLALPALAQDRCILVRRSAARMQVWDKMLYLNASGRRALAYALDRCGIRDHGSASLRRHLTEILTVQEDTYIYHEVGEIKDTVFDLEVWRRIISDFPHSPIELAARVVKDLLADTCAEGTLRHIVRNRMAAALGFFAAFQDGLGPVVFPELRSAFDAFVRTGDWALMQEAVLTGNENAAAYASAFMDIHREGHRRGDPKWTEAALEDQVLKKMGIGGPPTRKGAHDGSR